MNHRWMVGLLAAIILSSMVSAFIIDPASTGFGGKNRTDNLKNMTGQWLVNNASFLVTACTGGQYVLTPWYDTADSTRMNGTNGNDNLHSCQNATWHGNLTSDGYNNVSFCSVTDEASRNDYATMLVNHNDTLAQAIIHTIVDTNDSGNSYTNGHSGGNGTEWVVYANSTNLVCWNIIKNQVADTASDADNYLLLTAAAINSSPDFNVSNRQTAGVLLQRFCTNLIANNFFEVGSGGLMNRVNPSQNVTHFPCAGSNVCSSLGSTDVMFQGYMGPLLDALLACHSAFGDLTTNYSAYAEDAFQTHLMASNWTGNAFSTGAGRAYKWLNASTGQMPYATCTNSCTNTSGSTLGTEYPDSFRIPDINRAIWAWKNYTGRQLENSSVYNQEWASKACISNISFGYEMDFNGVNYNTCGDTGFRAVGFLPSILALGNASLINASWEKYNSHYGTCGGGSCEMDSQNAFGVYDKAMGITNFAYAAGLADTIFNGSGNVGAGSTNPPVITLVNATSITNTGAVIGWTTDTSSNSSALTGTTITGLGTITGQNDAVTTHSVTLAGLTPGTVYYYNVSSVDASARLNMTGNTTTGQPFNFTTTGSCSDAFMANGTTLVCTRTGCTFAGACVYNTTWATTITCTKGGCA